MFIKFTKASLLVVAAALAASPASAKPAAKPGKTIASVFEITDVSAARRHRHAARRHVRRGHLRRARHAEMRPVEAAAVVDRFGIGYQSATAPSYAERLAPVSRREERARVRRSFAKAQVPVNMPTASLFGSGLVAEARRYLGTNPTGRGRLWCGHFMNLVLRRSGREISNSNTARSFASYGHRVSGPQVGAIAVMSRGRRGGHVGVVSGIDGNGNPIIISGNHGGRVAESVYPRGRIFAYVMP